MLFNSYEFIFMFLPLSFFIYFYLNKKHLTEASKGFLVFASLFFYSWWNIAYLPLILISMLFNYVLGNQLSKLQHTHNKCCSKKSLLTIGVIVNLALLGYFKYSDFFIENVNAAFGTQVPLLHLALPLAISFYTFQQIAYLVDSYRGETKEYDFLNYAVFVTFFPQLIAGPIVHHAEMMPQFANIRNKVINYRNIALGLFIFSMGLFKKVVIADTFAVWATNGFDIADKLNLIEAWATSLSYTFQLYFDFSGYTDMAIGAALLFNIKLPINFNSPYKALSIQDFWRRWHMTLSRFLKDYIYIPLGGNRKGELRTYTNLFTTFLLGGIWHGAGWTFVFWGALHGIALIIHKAWQNLNIKLPTLLAWFVTFNFINIAWVFFRAKEWEDAIKVLHGMFFGSLVLPVPLAHKLEFMKSFGVEFGNWLSDMQADREIFAWLIAALITTLVFKNSMQLRETFKPNLLHMFTTILFFLSIFILYRKSEFIYFNF
ncbi:MAG TPA: MBOAT family protein [Arcobacter sp.]|nr:MBOAT family protein [Arcobacter sp.]